MNNYEDNFLRVINKPDKFAPEIWTRELKKIKIGTCFFGLLSIYKIQFTEWKKQ